MKKYTLLVLSLATVVALSLQLSSCSKDDPAPSPSVSFSDTDMSVDEDEGSVEIDVVLSSAAPNDIVVEYTLSGNADEGGNGDYEITSDFGEVEIKKGQTTGTIELDINDDGAFEGNETITITIDDVDDGILIGNDNKVDIEISDNDEQATVTLVETTRTVTESDGRIEIEVELDQPAGEDITIQYTLSGTAIDSLTGFDQEIASDYFIDGVSGEVEIAQGETTGTIDMVLYTDFFVEDGNENTAGLDPEKIIITLTGGTGGVKLGTDKTMEINLKQQDGRIILLEWDDPDTDSADLDMFYWIGPLGADPEELGTLGAFWSITPSYFGPEIVFIPGNLPQILLNGNPTDASFGVSYTYWGGNSNSLAVHSTFIDIVNGVVEVAGNRDNFDATYKLVNINEWDNDDTGENPAIVQTFDKQGGNYTNVSQIVVPATGSRGRTMNGKLPPNIVRGNKIRQRGLY